MLSLTSELLWTYWKNYGSEHVGLDISSYGKHLKKGERSDISSTVRQGKEVGV